jgi:hypothetical protein
MAGKTTSWEQDVLQILFNATAIAILYAARIGTSSNRWNR